MRLRQNDRDGLQLVYSNAAPERIRRKHSANTGSSQQLLQEQIASISAERDSLQRSLFEAAQVQRRLCSRHRVRDEQHDVAGELFPVRHLSGDFLCVINLDDRKLIGVGDISGKGLAAGMWLTHLVGMLNSYGRQLSNPADVAHAMNRELCQLQSVPLVTLFLCCLSAANEFSYCNAGHPPALIVRNSGRVELLKEGGPLLGAVENATYVCGRASLYAGDNLLGYSDGILECRDSSGEFFGHDRLAAAAQATAAQSANSQLFSVLAAVQDFAGGRSNEDDIALLVARRLG